MSYLKSKQLTHLDTTTFWYQNKILNDMKTWSVGVISE